MEKLANYLLEGELGRGGMGVVYKGWDEELQRHVAIKVMLESLASDETIVARFLREARSAAGLEHAAVVRVYTSGTWRGCPYFVMEYVEGETLADVIGREGALIPEKAVQLLSMAAQGLDVAHQRGIVHRDVKPANLLLDRSEQLKVADFGIALASQLENKLTATGQFLGTPGYLSPEVCLGETLDARSDIFALGIVFYEMLTGNQPFRGESPMATMNKVVEARVPDHLRLHELDASIRSVLSKMLAPKPEDRFQTCGALLEELTGYLENFSPTRAATQPLVSPTVLNTKADQPKPEVIPGKRKYHWPQMVAVLVLISAVVFISRLTPKAEPNQDVSPVFSDVNGEVAQPRDESGQAEPLPMAYIPSPSELAGDSAPIPAGQTEIPEPSSEMIHSPTSESESHSLDDVVHTPPEDTRTVVPAGAGSIAEPMNGEATSTANLLTPIDQQPLGHDDQVDILPVVHGSRDMGRMAISQITKFLPDGVEIMDPDLIKDFEDLASLDTKALIDRFTKLRGDHLLVLNVLELGEECIKIKGRYVTTINVLLSVELFDANSQRQNLNWFSLFTITPTNINASIKRELRSLKRPLLQVLNSQDQNEPIVEIHALGDSLIAEPLTHVLAGGLDRGDFAVGARQVLAVGDSLAVNDLLTQTNADFLVFARVEQLGKSIVPVEGRIDPRVFHANLSLKVFAVADKGKRFDEHFSLDYSQRNHNQKAESFIKEQLGPILRSLRN